MKKKIDVITIFSIVLLGVFFGSKKTYAASIPEGYVIDREVVVQAYSSNFHVPGLTLYVDASDTYYPEVTVTSSISNSSSVAVPVTRAISEDGKLVYRNSITNQGSYSYMGRYTNTKKPFLYNIAYCINFHKDSKVKERIEIKYFAR